MFIHVNIKIPHDSNYWFNYSTVSDFPAVSLSLFMSPYLSCIYPLHNSAQIFFSLYPLASLNSSSQSHIQSHCHITLQGVALLIISASVLSKTITILNLGNPWQFVLIHQPGILHFISKKETYHWMSFSTLQQRKTWTSSNLLKKQ